MTDPVRAAALAVMRQITDTVVNAVLEWGEAANEADALPEGASKEVAVLRARVAGTEVQRLAMGLAARLRPRGNRGTG